MANLLNKFKEKLEGDDHHDRDDRDNEGFEQGEGVTEHHRGIRQGTRRKQEESDRSELYSGTSQGYEGVPSEDTGAYMHSGNTGRDRDSSRAETNLGGDRDMMEEADADTFTSGQGQQARRGMAKDWSQQSGSYNAEQSGSYSSGTGMGSGRGSGNEEMMGSDRGGGNW
ncbi:hypothetical protein HG536_0D04010 [Torulaspora globosa]|uniref:Uncharacterized protein n=1 Tax=Torulaspora globosa TaxID=48254 RepID=A0A7G3ZH93_9SACH|nr:uncharacterized protein HG536_0D04010 [Torulaspora globosa]QLL32879.1 hypothetical protein HG536_0D04010 [Torulaspora globosa]